MAKRKVQFVQGAYYHIYNRGANLASIFRCDRDYQAVISLMKKYTTNLNLTIPAYCLMPNHYHWLVHQRGTTPARLLPQYVFNSYVKSFNSRYQHSGTLFEGTFEAILINNTTHLRHLCRYIHGNPVKDGFAIQPELWQYSNYLDWTGKREDKLIDREFIQQFFPKVELYPRWVGNYLAGLDPLPQAVQEYFSQLSC